MGSTIARQVDLGCISRVAEQARRSKLKNSVPSWFLFQFLFPGSCLELLEMIDCKLGQDFITIAEAQTRTNSSNF